MTGFGTFGSRHIVSSALYSAVEVMGLEAAPQTTVAAGFVVEWQLCPRELGVTTIDLTDGTSYVEAELSGALPTSNTRHEARQSSRPQGGS